MKVEQLGSGAVYCQIFDVIYPGIIPMSRVNWKANTWNEFLANFKILQQGFDKIGVDKEMPVSKLTKAKYMDNLEFAQWFKTYYDEKIDLLKIYDAEQRRNYCEVDLSFADKGAKGNKTRVMLAMSKKIHQFSYISDEQKTNHNNVIQLNSKIQPIDDIKKEYELCEKLQKKLNKIRDIIFNDNEPEFKIGFLKTLFLEDENKINNGNVGSISPKTLATTSASSEMGLLSKRDDQTFADTHRDLKYDP